MGGRLRLVAVLAVLFAIWLPTIASADAGKERQFTDLVHRERASAGVAAYAGVTSRRLASQTCFT